MNTPNKRKSSADPMGNETPEKKKFIMGKKSRTKFIWFKCVTCLKKSKSDSKYCQNVDCSGKMANIFSVRRNLSGHPVRCFVNKESRSCSFCTLFQIVFTCKPLQKERL